jgi:cytochrome c peroxidase
VKLFRHLPEQPDAIVKPMPTMPGRGLVVHSARAWLTIVAAVLGLACSAHDPRARAAAVVALGRTLFFDTGLSGDGKVACATCHEPERAYTDGLARASGIAGRQGARNTPSLLDVGRQRSLFWDGRRARL